MLSDKNNATENRTLLAALSLRDFYAHTVRAKSLRSRGAVSLIVNESAVFPVHLRYLREHLKTRRINFNPCLVAVRSLPLLLLQRATAYQLWKSNGIWDTSNRFEPVLCVWRGGKFELFLNVIRRLKLIGRLDRFRRPKLETLDRFRRHVNLRFTIYFIFHLFTVYFVLFIALPNLLI